MNSFNEENYSATLTDPRWQRKRLEIFQRDNFTCVECGSAEKTLHVHHKKYKPNTEPWDYQDDNFQTLCWECHEKKSDKRFPRKMEENIFLNPKGAVYRPYRPKNIKPSPVKQLKNRKDKK